MTPTRPLQSPFVALALALAPLAAGAQTGACGVGNVRNWCVSQDSSGVTGVSQAGDHFGSALAFGDFDGDGAGDLAVGAPGESAGGAANAGAVWVFYGSAAGLHAGREQVFDQDNLPGGDGGTETGDQFGFAVAAGDVDGDGFDDLAIGSPFENQPDPSLSCGFDLSCDDVGLVHLIFGSASGLAAGARLFAGPGVRRRSGHRLQPGACGPRRRRRRRAAGRQTGIDGRESGRNHSQRPASPFSATTARRSSS